MLITLLIHHFPHPLLQLHQLHLILVHGQEVLLLVSVREMLLGPFLQDLQLFFEGHSHVRLRNDVDVLNGDRVTLILCFMRSYQCVLARSLAFMYFS